MLHLLGIKCVIFISDMLFIKLQKKSDNFTCLLSQSVLLYLYSYFYKVYDKFKMEI